MGVLQALRSGVLTVEGRLVVASNVTLIGEVDLAECRYKCVYKPISGERPLWDFPDGSLAGREVAAFEVSEAAGWHVVPPTTMRADGPAGPGMCQLWIDQDDRLPSVDVVSPGAVPAGWLPILQAVDGDGAPVTLVHADDADLRRLALFDVVVNNADRKGGHILFGEGCDGVTLAGLVGVDHGVAFHSEPKLRTVLWGWADAELTDAERADLKRLQDALGGGPLQHRLAGLITPDEITATESRIHNLLKAGVLPPPTGRMPVPWPVF